MDIFQLDLIVNFFFNFFFLENSLFFINLIIVVRKVIESCILSKYTINNKQ